MWDPELVHVAGLEQSSTSMPSRLVTLFCFTYSDPKIFIGCIEQWILCRYSAMDKQTVASWPWRIPAMDWYGLAKSLVSSLKACHFLFFFLAFLYRLQCTSWWLCDSLWKAVHVYYCEGCWSHGTMIIDMLPQRPSEVWYYVISGSSLPTSEGAWSVP